MEKQPFVFMMDDTDHRGRKIGDSLFVFGFVQPMAHKLFPGYFKGFQHLFAGMFEIGVFQEVA